MNAGPPFVTFKHAARTFVDMLPASFPRAPVGILLSAALRFL
jgi:hypothetical protein